MGYIFSYAFCNCNNWHNIQIGIEIQQSRIVIKEDFYKEQKMKPKDFGAETNVFLLDTSELDLKNSKGLKGKEYNVLPSIGELEAWFIFECPHAIEQVGLDPVIDSACEAFGIERDVIEPLVLLLINRLKNTVVKQNTVVNTLFKTIE